MKAASWLTWIIGLGYARHLGHQHEGWALGMILAAGLAALAIYPWRTVGAENPSTTPAD